MTTTVGARMRRVLAPLCLAACCSLAFRGIHAARAQENPGVDHAKRVLELLEHEKFDEVAREFNGQVAAMLSAKQLGDAWSALRQQAGQLTALIDQRTTTPSAGVTAVILGCQFEKAAVNIVVAFDAENKIGGLRFMPRPSSTPPNPAQPTSSRFKEESVTVGTGEWALPGTLSMPVGSIAAAVVLVHGSGPGDRDETVGANTPFRDLAWGLADRGIAVLRYEKRTRQYPVKIAGNDRFTVREETIEDAILAAALLRAHDRIDPKRVFLLGHSLGGTLAPRIAVEDRSLAGLVILAGATRPVLEAARAQLAYLTTLTPGGINSDEVLQKLRGSVPESYWKDLDAYKPAQVAATLSIPMLILQGERDYQVTLDDLQGWRDALAGQARVTIKTYPALNHLFLPGEGKSTPAEYARADHIPEFVFDDIAGWLQKT